MARTFIARIEEVNPRLNAVVIPRFEQAVAEAAAADERQARGERLGPLHGVPITIKECFHLAGTKATIGTVSWRPTRDMPQPHWKMATITP